MTARASSNAMRKLIVVGVVALSALAAACGKSAQAPEITPTSLEATATAVPPMATVPSCPTPPSGPQFSEVFTATATITVPPIPTLSGLGVDSGSCSDTVTFTFSGAVLPSYEVKYVQAATECGRGLPVTTAGSAQISVRFEPANAHDDSGSPTVDPAPRTPNFASIKEVKTWCDFEAVVGWVIGTEAQYYNVMAAHDPPRLIVEVYH